MGLPRTYVRFVCLSLNTHFAETGPGGALQLAGYWEVFSPGPLTLGTRTWAGGSLGCESRSTEDDRDSDSEWGIMVRAVWALTMILRRPAQALVKPLTEAGLGLLVWIEELGRFSGRSSGYY